MLVLLRNGVDFQIVGFALLGHYAVASPLERPQGGVERHHATGLSRQDVCGRLNRVLVYLLDGAPSTRSWFALREATGSTKDRIV